MPLEPWRPGLPGDRLPQVTAIGHGDPAFAAFYPGCRSVFGFQDTDFAGSRPPSGTRYEVAGWVSAAAQDTLAGLATGAGWRTAPADGFGWGVPDGPGERDGGGPTVGRGAGGHTLSTTGRWGARTPVADSEAWQRVSRGR
ncbi:MULTISPECIES: hypothetical protein [unclassified Streptosporangium]|uniref:hypothetical protein n=1 Tax=unclassified Streptosporangium TaxID=2632669 RepID=UPI002E2A2048|nr:MULTISPECIES: hypothetical protein [unclassified Streptosporangium]